MRAGAWGARAGALLERAGARESAPVERTDARWPAPVERVGDLSMLRGPDLHAGPWRCWLFGEPEDGGALAERFGVGADVDVRGAFGRALAELGEGACELLCGRFVAVLLDRDRNRCLIARDQLGAHPLVYAEVKDGILFAEHERDLLDLLPQTPAPDRLALLQWVQGGLLPRERTLYEGVRRLPAGHRLVLEAGRLRTERWWEVRYRESEAGSRRELTARLREEVLAAVGRAAAGCKRPAVALSGGLDSACVAAGVAAGGWTDAGAHAVGGSFAGHPLADETELIEQTARHTRLPLRLVAFDPGGSMLAPALAHIARWRLPPATPTLFLWQPLMAAARELGVDAALDGEGGDELFGIAPWLIADELRAARLPTAWSLSGEVPGLGAHAGVRTRLRVLRRYGLGPLLPASIQRRRSMRALRDASSALIGRADAEALAELQAESEAGRRAGPLWWRHKVESVLDMRERSDVAGHFSREAADACLPLRHPFMDDLRLIEAVLGLPPQMQFDPVRDRPLLRDAMIGLIPEAVRTRHGKSHFNSLLLAGMRADEEGLIAPLRRADAPIRSCVAPAAVERMAAAPPQERSMTDVGTLWSVAIANRWLLSLA